MLHRADDQENVETWSIGFGHKARDGNCVRKPDHGGGGRTLGTP